MRFQGKQIATAFPFGENEQWQTLYIRFISDTMLDLNVKGKRISDSTPSVLEAMDFFGEKKS